MKKSPKWGPIFGLFLLFPVAVGAVGGSALRVTHQILAQDAVSFTVRIEFSTLQRDGQHWFKEAVAHQFLATDDSLWALPAAELPLVCFRKPRIRLIRAHSRVLQFDAPIRFPREIILDSTSSGQGKIPLSAQPPPRNALIQLRKIGSFRDFPLWALQLFPVQIGASGQTVRLTDTVIVRVDFGARALQKTWHEGIENPDVLAQLKTLVVNPQAVANVRPARRRYRFRKTKSLPPLQRKMVGFKLFVSRKGWYKVTESFLKKQNIPLGEVNWRKVAISLKGKPVAFVSHGLEDGHFDPGDCFEFWGHPNYNTLYPKADDMYFDPYALSSAYFVTWDGTFGHPYGTQRGDFFRTDTTTAYRPRSFMSTVHAERDRQYSRLSRVTPGVQRDHWFWATLGAGEIQNFSVTLPAPDLNSNRVVKVKIMLHGVTYGHHKVRAFLSNHRVLEGDWYDQTKFSLKTKPTEGIAGSQLDDQENALTLVNDSDDPLDFFLLNWFEVTYPRLYKATNDFIQFSRPDDWPNGRYQFSIEGFSRPDVEVYRIGQSQIFGGEVKEVTDSLGEKSYRLTFETTVSSPKADYVALTPDAKLQPQSARGVYASTLKDTTNQADYLVITAPYFSDNKGLRDLIALRENQGLTVKIALTDEIYDLFSNGEKSPVGIKNFLTYAYHRWKKPAPTYVILVGDGNYAVRSERAQAVNFVPVYHYQTIKFGASVSDTWYALVSGEDLVPDYFIGRLPARTNQELNAICEKIVAYETTAPNGTWRNRLLMIAGRDQFFHDQNAELAKRILPQDFLVRKFTAFPPNDPFYGDRNQLLNYLNQGVSYVNYMGHGGGAVWADNLLFRFDDVRLLQNGPRYPVVTSMTCFTAAFDSPSEVSCLGEEMLTLPHQGVVAFLGSSGVGWVWNDYYFLKQILHHLFLAQAPTVGAAIALAKIDYQAQYFTPQRESMVHQYNLLGDPALRPIFPQDSLALQPPPLPVKAGDSLKIQVTSSLGKGRFTGAIVDSLGKIGPHFSQMYAGQDHLSIQIPQTFRPGLYHIPLDFYPVEGQANFHGVVHFAVGQSGLLRTAHRPKSVCAGDSVWISAKFVGLGEHTQVWCAFEAPRPESFPMVWKPAKQLFETAQAVQMDSVGLAKYAVFWQEGATTRHSPSFQFRVNQLPDLRVVPGSISFSVQDSLVLQAEIQNAGAIPLKNVPVVFFQIGQTDSQKIGLKRVNFKAFETKKVSIQASLPSGENRIRVVVDPAGKIKDRKRENNSAEKRLVPSAFRFVPGKGFLAGRTRVDSLCRWENSGISAPARKMARPFLIQFENQPWDEFRTEQEFTPFRPSNGGKSVLFLTLTPETSTFEDSVRFFVVADRPLLAVWNRSVFLFHYFSERRLWARVRRVSVRDSILSAKISASGAYAFLKTTDRVPPKVEISIGKRGFYEGGYVAQDAAISVETSDENGVFPSIQAQKFLLDGTPVNFRKIITNFSGKSAAFLFSPELKPGEHQFAVQVRDCAGNVSEQTSVTFRVAAQFQVHFLGNYPNPFRDKTVFAYELTAPASELDLRIFTVSGRLVRKIEALDILNDPDPLEAGYHEIEWDGTDDDGEEIANGVYYFKLTAKNETKTVRKIGKLARIK